MVSFGCGLDRTPIQVNFQVRGSLTTAEGTHLSGQPMRLQGDKGRDTGTEIKIENHFEQTLTTGQDGLTEFWSFGYKLQDEDVVRLTGSHPNSANTFTKTISYTDIYHRASGAEEIGWQETLPVTVSF
jgi:hypothetical protein